MSLIPFSFEYINVSYKTSLAKETTLSERCFYNVVKWYSIIKAACDGKLKRSRTHICNRPAHWDEQGRLLNKCFFRALNIARDGCGHNRPHCHRNVGQTEVQGTLEYWNQQLKLTRGTRFEKKPGEKAHRLTTDMARRTFCTLAELDTSDVILILMLKFDYVK